MKIKSLQEILEDVKAVKYGQISVTYVLRAGKVVQVIKRIEEVEKVD